VPFETIHGIRIYYEIHGEGDTIVLLHHGFGCTKMWKHIYPQLVEKGYRVIMYDRRGYGRSEKGADFQEFYESERFCSESVRDLAALRKILSLDVFHIISHCEGGVIGLEYAVRYPEHIKTIVTSSTQCYSTMSMIEFNRLKLSKSFQDLEPDLRAKMIEWHGEAEAESSYNQFSKYGGAYGKGFFDLRPFLPSVTCPTLVLYPDRSMLFEVEQAVAFYRHLPRGELAVLPACGHNTYEDRPEEYFRHVIAFLKRHNY
jgi:pimeloyl-ACP methyl ester carboxylesterase